MFKKITTLMVAVLFAFVMGACSDDDPEPKKTDVSIVKKDGSTVKGDGTAVRKDGTTVKNDVTAVKKDK